MFPVSVHGSIGPTSIAVAVEGSSKTGSWFIPDEVPVAFSYNRRNYAVMLATPDDLVDFGFGFSLSEKLISTWRDVRSLDIYLSDKGADLRFKIKPESVEKIDLVMRRRNLVGSASCGLCGLENADQLFVPLKRVSDERVHIAQKTLNSAIENFPSRQALNQKTRTVHAAAWVNLDGEIEIIREDVGRHNALDKLIGAMVQDVAVSTDKGFVVMSSRCSYEIVEKAAHAKIKSILSISAPTAFAVRKAKEANMSLYVRAEKDVVRIV